MFIDHTRRCEGVGKFINRRGEGDGGMRDWGIHSERILPQRLLEGIGGAAAGAVAVS